MRSWKLVLGILVSFLALQPAPSEAATVSLAVVSPATGTVQILTSVADTTTTRLDIVVDGRVVASCPNWWCLYAWPTPSVSNGLHVVTATGYNAASVRTGSATQNVIVSNVPRDTTPPTVILQAPATASGLVTLQTSAQDASPIASLEIQVDGVKVASGSAASLVYGWDTRSLPNGGHAIRALATDANGNVGVSAVVQTTVSNVAPAPVPSPSAPDSDVATLPLVSVDTTQVSPTGRTIQVPSGGDFQAALNTAQGGDLIVLQAGASYRGPFTLPAKGGSSWITIRSSAAAQLPAPGTRVTPAHSSAMPKLIAPAWNTAVVTGPGAHHYRFEGIEFSASEGFVYNLVLLGNDETSESQLPHHLIFDRCYLHGHPAHGTRRGIAMNSRHTAVIDSHLSQFAEVGNDSQAIAAWNGSGPFKIMNNYLEGAGENVMFGGVDPAIYGLVPSDIEIRGNRLTKPLSWRVGHPSYRGIRWSVKNLLELKNARRVLIQDNVFEHNWGDSQAGFAILFTVRNQNGTAPWSTVEDVTFVDNVVRNTANGINILGLDTTWPAGSRRVARILIQNNLFSGINGPAWNGTGLLFQILEGPSDLVIDHNTAMQTGNIVTAEGPPATGFIFTNNIVPHNAYGIMGTGHGPGTPTLNRFFPGATVSRNVFVDGYPTLYPADNFFPDTLSEIGFVNPATEDFELGPSSPYRGLATDGTDIGVLF